MILLVIALAINGAACSRLFGPSNEDVLKAINDSGLTKSGGFTVTGPIQILEKGKREPDGAWPVKVSLTLTVTSADGKTKELTTTPTFKIFQNKNSDGKTVWAARLGG